MAIIKKKFLNILRAKGKTFIIRSRVRTDANKASVKLVATHKGRIAGRMLTSVINRKAFVRNVNTKEDFRKMGVSTKLFRDTMQALSKKKINFLRGEDIINEAQIRIRSKFRSKFVVKESFIKSKTRINAEGLRAIDAIRRNRRGGDVVSSISASTKVPKSKPRNIKVTAKPRKIKFVRIRGKIRPIRIKDAK